MHYFRCPKSIFQTHFPPLADWHHLETVRFEIITISKKPHMFYQTNTIVGAYTF